jgi:competence protein ComEC
MRDWFDNQYQNLFLYVPFLLAFGAALYFIIPYEPNLIFAPVILCLTGVTIFIRRVPNILRAALIFLFGFCYAYVFTDFIDTPKLTHNKHNLEITGVVHNIDYTDDKSRVYLSVSARDIGADDNGRATVRVSVSNMNLPKIGDTIRVNIGLFQPAGAYAPETFDYARWAYFNNLTATGYVNEIKVIETNGATGMNALRNRIHNRAESFLVDSLVLGYKNAVPKNDTPIWTATGIGHVWSISGFHMTLVGGWVFLVFYFLFRAIPYITRRVPARIPAMGCAWIALLGYLFLSGLDIATIRAFIMTTLVFLAFACGRSAISVRNIALAFCIIFFINPHYVMQAGFQLSFAAVFGLVWVYSDIKPKMPRNKILKIIYACIITSVIATIFTAPFVAMHFGAIPIYGLIGNLILLPIFSFVIMPLVLFGAIFGAGAPIDIAHSLYDFTFMLAQNIANIPCATVAVPHVSNMAAVCFIIGFICLMIIKPIKIKVNYILFLLFCGIGVEIVYLTPKAVFMATYDNELVAFLRDDGKLEFNKSRASNHYFAFDTWKQINGENTNTPNPRRKHEHGVYRYRDIVYIQKFVPLMKNIKALCNDDNVRYIVSYFDIKSENCANKILRGGFVIYPDGRVRHVANKRRWD